MMNIITAETGNTLPATESADGRDPVIEKNLYFSASNIDSKQMTLEQKRIQALEKRAAAARHAMVNLRTEE
ncbi:MAG: hypothetical protein RLT30_04500 [Gammaproteobacteria bacterium]